MAVKVRRWLLPPVKVSFTAKDYESPQGSAAEFLTKMMNRHLPMELRMADPDEPPF